MIIKAKVTPVDHCDLCDDQFEHIEEHFDTQLASTQLNHQDEMARTKLLANAMLKYSAHQNY